MTTKIRKILIPWPQKKKPFGFFFGCPVGFLRLRSGDFVDGEPGFSSHGHKKKKPSGFFFGCPVGFEPTTFRTTI